MTDTKNRKRLFPKFKDLSGKDKIKKIAGLIFIILGAAAIISAIAVPIINKNRNAKNVSLIKENIPQKTNTPENITTDDAAQVTTESTEVTQESSKSLTQELLDKNGCIGVIIIDKIGAELAIEEGDDDETLKRSVGHMTSSSAIGENGNCVLSAHHGGYYGEFFENIDSLEDEDIICLIDKNGNTYKYAVYDKQIIKRTNWSVVEDLSPNMATLTLITCVDRTQEERIIVSAVRFQ